MLLLLYNVNYIYLSHLNITNFEIKLVSVLILLERGVVSLVTRYRRANCAKPRGTREKVYISRLEG